MSETQGTADLQLLLAKAVLPSSAWLLYGCFFYFAFLIGSDVRQFILLGLLALGVAISLSEAAAPPGLPEKVRAKDPILCMLGALAVYAAVRRGGMSPALACSVVGTAAGLLGFAHNFELETYAGPIYCGGFVGMTSALILPDPRWILAAGLVAGYFYSVSGPVVRGVGGKMGSTAFAGAILAVLLARAGGMAGPGARTIPVGSDARLAMLLAAMCAAPVTYWLAQKRGLNVILGSALPSLVFAVAFERMGHGLGFSPGPVVATWFGSSFAGMTLPTRVGNRHWLLPLMGLLFGVLWISFRPPLVGIGGGLGATAAISVLAVLGAVRLPTLMRATAQSFRKKSWSV